ncbi:MAG: 3'-5' exonuclease [Candidatus Micrarchaeia archaeon]
MVIDVETTGLDPKKNSIISIGAVDFSNPKRQFYRECRPWEGAIIEEAALSVNGFKRDSLFDPNKPSLKEAISEFLSWLLKSENQTLAGHNFGSFDSKFIQAAIEIYNLNHRIQSRSVDLHSICYADHLRKGIAIPMKWNKANITSDYVFNYVGLPEEPHPHIAITGAKFIAESFSRLIYGKILLDEFKKYKIPSHLKQK